MQNNQNMAKPQELKKPLSRPVPKSEQTKVVIPNRPQPPRANPQGQRQRPTGASPAFFHNPYNFVPTPPRKQSDLGLDDNTPVGHSCYLPNLWSGRITVSLTTKTPLLLPDAQNMSEDGKRHKTYSTRLVDKKPYLAPTSLKGMLRSAYESVTNSRMSIFSNQGDSLAFRLNTNLGQQMVPAQIKADESGAFKIQLYPGTSEIGSDGRCRGKVYAAWLPRYKTMACKYSDDSLPQHGDIVKAWVELVERLAWKKGGYEHRFFYWRIVELARLNNNSDLLSENPPVSPLDEVPQTKRGNSFHRRRGQVNLIPLQGIVCISNENSDNKHDERVFFVHDLEYPEESEELLDSYLIGISKSEQTNLSGRWNQLITNYQEIHEDEEESPFGTAWSRHIKNSLGEMPLSERQLKNGTLCFAHVKISNNDLRVLGLHPVMLSRGFFNESPLALLQETLGKDGALNTSSLEPAENWGELSPADRVFGWISQSGKGTYKGQLRIHNVVCQSGGEALEKFEPALALNILGQPKPAQFRFYSSSDKLGNPIDVGARKEEGYSNAKQQGLRGRKVYPHHRLTMTGDYWNRESTNPDITKEYLKPGEQHTSQNRSITSWVKPAVEFTFDIDVVNLSDVELGALLYLLELPENHYHRLGGGKPLGFGSVKLMIDRSDLRTGQGWRDYYRSLSPTSASDQTVKIAELKQRFLASVTKAYGHKGDLPEFLLAFARSAQGFDDELPICYPPMDVQPNLNGEGSKWFVDNEGTHGKKLSLPALVNDKGLPWNPKN
jgi:CRISPR-associated protein (TIGR03986 family)